MALFKPGESGNPNGRPVMPSELKEAKRLTFIDFQNLVYKYLEYTQEELKEVLAAPHTTAKDALIASVMAKAIFHGDVTRFEWLLVRIFGKQIIETAPKGLSAEDVDNPLLLRKIPNDILLKLLKAKDEPGSNGA